jgi:CRP-like cAMP-binding protein
LPSEQLFDPLIRRWEKLTPLDAADRAAIEALPLTRRALERDSYLVREGTNPQNCSLILEGFAYRHKLVNTGSRQIISIHIRGEFVDLQNCLLGIADHHVQTLSRTEVAFIPRSALLELTERRPAINKAMWIDTLIDSSIFREWVVNVATRPAGLRTSFARSPCASREPGSPWTIATICR